MTIIKTSSAGLDRRNVLKGAAAVGGALLLPAQVRAATAGPRKGGTLRVSMPYNPGALDPMTGRNLTDLNVLYQIFDALIDFEPDTLELKPGLAKAWRFTDPKTLVLDLMSGVEFHDGSPFNPEVVKFNLDRYRTDQRSNVKSDLSSVDKVEVTGKNQVTLHLKKINVGLPNILTNRAGLMVSMKAIKEHGPNVDRKPVGTGPFTLTSWEDNASIVLDRNKNYWRSGLPYLDSIHMGIINDQNTVARTVTAGQADLAINMGAKQKDAADHMKKGLVTKATPSLVFFGAFLNYSRAPLSDKRVRQALNWAIDRDVIVRVTDGGYGEASSAILPSAYWACDKTTAQHYHYDPDRAKKLLAEAGHADGIEIKTWGWPFPDFQQRQELIRAQLAKAGIRLKLTIALPAQVMQNYAIKKQGDMAISPVSCYPDPSQLYEAVFGKNALRNASGIEVPGFRPLMNATEEAQTMDERKEAFAKLQKFVIDEALELPQFIADGINIMTPKLKNYKLGLLTTPKFAEVWLEA
jgi:peptide/nickel transport system substrate-binding protein/glutathione transport system substrate-binding protein